MGAASAISPASFPIAAEPPTIGTAHGARSRRFSDSSERASAAFRSRISRRSSETGFSRKSYAPARVASTAASIVACPDIMMTRVSGVAARISFSSAIPLPSGNHTSSSTKSNASSSRARAAPGLAAPSTW